MRKPLGVIYGVGEPLPPGVNLLNGAQQVGLSSIYMIFPALIVKEGGGSAEIAAAVVSMTMLALAIGTILQTIRVGRIGSGYLCQPGPSVLYFVPSLLAVKHGGLPAMFGMTVAAGFFEAALSRFVSKMRPLFPPEIAGLVVLLAGISIGSVGIRTALGDNVAHFAPVVSAVGIAVLTLAIMVALNIWGRGPLRMFCVSIGMTLGYLTDWAWTGAGDETTIAALAVASPAVSPAWFAMPDFGYIGWSFDASLVLPFAIAAVAASLNVMGNVTTSQKVNDADWVRPDMDSIRRGVIADGLGTAVAGALGTQGITSLTGAIGLASATGVMSRNVGWSVAAIQLGLAFMPGLGHRLYLMPRPVAGAALLFASTFIVINGLQIMTSRLLDARKTLVIGLSLVIGLGVEIFPGMLGLMPEAVRQSVGSSLVFGTVIALVLNGLFRIGQRKSESFTVQPGAVDHDVLGDFLEKCGGQWGARRDIIGRAQNSLWQAIDVLSGTGGVGGPLGIEAVFDEFNLDLRVSYEGAPLTLAKLRPSADEIVESEGGERRLAGYLLGRSADRFTETHNEGRSTLILHFDH